MGIQIRMIGTGNAFAKNFFNNNALVEANGYRLLIDCGITAPYALSRLDVPLTDIDGIIVTHIHGDHIGGLEEVAFRMKFVHGKKIPLYVPSPIAAPLWDYSLKGAMEDRSSGSDSLESYFDVRSMEAYAPTLLHDGLTLELIPTRHVPNKPSFGILLNDSVFYSSDMTFDPELIISLVDGGRCRHILHECQLEGQGIVHTTLAELLTLPERIQERIWLMHYEDVRDNYMGKTGRMRFLDQQTAYAFD